MRILGPGDTPVKEFRVNPGGLMRCCLQSLQEAMSERRTPLVNGETLACKYEKDTSYNQMVYDQGVWRWNREASGVDDATKTAS